MALQASMQFRDRLRLAIADSMRYQSKCGVLFCDLDQFKVINDSLGHEAGDQAFVKGIEADSAKEAIVRAIVSMARAMDFYVIAEGVETEAELKLIKQSECDAVQGFYLCQPQSPEELAKP